MEKIKEIIEIEKKFNISIDDFAIENNAIECITFRETDISNEKINASLKYLINLKRLFIFNCKIENANFIDELIHLEELTISNSNLELFDIKQENKNLKILDLSENKLKDITFLKLYKNINSLNLSENKIKDILVLKNFKNFKNLNLMVNEISDISSLKNIKIDYELFLGSNKIFDITPLYHSLKQEQIKFLHIYDNPLIYPHQDIVIRGENAIVSWFDKIIENCNYKINLLKKEDVSIDLGKMGVTDLSLLPKLFEIEQLEELILSNEWAEYNDNKKKWERKESINTIYKRLENNIENIPQDIIKLKKLKKLIIGGNWKGNEENYIKWRIKDCSVLWKLTNLEFINISNNEINDITGLTKLTKINIAHFNNNNISKVPRLNKLNNLKEIYLSNNYIKDVNFLNDCIQIETVDLHSNKINDLTGLKELLIKSKINIKNSSWEKNCISINKNDKNITPPYEIINQSKNDFINYITLQEYEVKLQLESYYNKEIKIVLVGNSYSGKSTFLNYLKTKRYKKNLPITHWLIKDSHDFIIDKEKYKLRFFDFGGQDYYHDTHKLFFTSDCIYFLLWDAESNKLGKITTERDGLFEETQVFPLEYWLDSIKLYSKKTMSESELQMEKLLNERDRKINQKIRDPKKGDWTKDVYENIDLIKKNLNPKKTLIIQNKIDVKKEFLNQSKLTSSKNDYNIFDFVDISISNKIGLSQFKELYIQIIKENSNYKKPLLATWGVIKDNLSVIFEADNFIINISVFKERINIFLTKWLNDQEISEQSMSKLLFKEEEIISFANFLKEVGLVIYDSQNDELKDVIVVNQNDFLKQVYKIINEAKANSGSIKFDSKIVKENDNVIKILVNQNIIFENKTEREYIAPLFLPENPEYFVDLLIDKKIPFRRFNFNGFIPKNIILSVFSKLSKKDISKEDFYFWKNGLIFKDINSNQKVMLIFEIKYDKYLNLNLAYIDLINLSNNSNGNFIDDILSTIKEIIEKECSNCDEMVTIDGIYFAKMSKLIDCKENNIKYIRLYHKDVVKETNVSNFDKYLPEDKRSFLKKAIISYSKKDLRLIEEFKLASLGSLIQDEYINEWYCTDLIAGEVWNEEIQNRVSNCDIAFIMISKYSINTDYIKAKEIKILIDRFNNPNEEVKPIIIPIILEPYHWTSKDKVYNLGQFSALPYTAKPVVDFRDRNNAWYIIGECIRIAIENKIATEELIGKEYWNDYWSKQEVGNDVKDLFIRMIEGKLNNNSN
jgi:internalin A